MTTFNGKKYFRIRIECKITIHTKCIGAWLRKHSNLRIETTR